MLSFGDMGEIKMVNAIVKQDMGSALEQVIIGGDLSALTPADRVIYYNRVCDSIGLNALTKPFEFLRLNGKLVLYARRDAADQLRTIHGISLSKPHIEYVDDLIIVTIEATNKHGRTDTDLGAVSVKGLQGEAKANAILKAVTKAKRRVTLSIAGLGWLDETEVDTIPGAQRVTVDTETGEILEATSTKPNADINFYSRSEATQPAAGDKLAALKRERLNVEMSDLEHNHEKRELARVDAEIAKLEQRPSVQATEGNGTPNPFNDDTSDAPTEEVLTIISQWRGPGDAQIWAQKAGYCENDHHAKQSWMNSVKECRGYTDKNKMEVFAHFAQHQLSKAQEQQQAA